MGQGNFDFAIVKYIAAGIGQISPNQGCRLNYILWSGPTLHEKLLQRSNREQCPTIHTIRLWDKELLLFFF